VDSGRGSIAGEYILRCKPRRPCHVSSSVLPTLVYIDMCYNEQGGSAIDHKLAHIDTCVRGQSRRTQGGLLVGPGGACVRAARLLRIRKSKCIYEYENMKGAGLLSQVQVLSQPSKKPASQQRSIGRSTHDSMAQASGQFGEGSDRPLAVDRVAGAIRSVLRKKEACIG